MLCVSVVSLEPQTGRILYEKSSAVTSLSLAPDEERVFLAVDRHAPFPLSVSVKMLFYTPTPEDLKSHAEEEDEEEVAEPEVEEGCARGDELHAGDNLDGGSLGDVVASELANAADRQLSPSSSSSVRKNLTRSFDGADDSASAGTSAAFSPPSSSRSLGHPRSPQSLKPSTSSSVIDRPL